MKFLVDAHLPYSLSVFLKSIGFDSIHTFDLPNKNKTEDDEIIAIAKKENRIVISKDDDFLGGYILKKQPQKLLMVKTGNISNKELHIVFSLNIRRLKNLFSNHSLIEINKIEVIVHR